MKAGTMAAIGGLLGGVGKGIQQNYEEKRALALAALKRQWDVEDAEAASAAELAKEDRKHENALELIDVGAERDKDKIKATGEETRKTETLKGDIDAKADDRKFRNDRALATLQSSLRQQEDRASKLLADRLDQDDVQSVETAEDGSLVVVKKNGGVETTGVKLHIKDSGGDDEGGGTIAGARERREGKPAAAKTEEVAADSNRLRTLYANATPQTAPRLFRDGKKLPYAEFERLMRGGQ